MMINISMLVFLMLVPPPSDITPLNLDIHKNLTTHFKIKDFHVGCKDIIPRMYLKNLCRLATNLEVLQEHIGRPIKIISGYRSKRCNRLVRGAKRSQHMLGKAADIRVRGMSSRRLKRIIEKLIRLKKMQQGGIGLYKRHVHYDVREKRARWYRLYAMGICK